MPAQARLSAMAGSNGSKHASRQDAAGKDSPNRHSKVSPGSACQPWGARAVGASCWLHSFTWTCSSSAPSHSSPIQCGLNAWSGIRSSQWCILAPAPTVHVILSKSLLQAMISSFHPPWLVSSPAQAALTKTPQTGWLINSSY